MNKKEMLEGIYYHFEPLYGARWIIESQDAIYEYVIANNIKKKSELKEALLKFNIEWNKNKINK